MIPYQHCHPGLVSLPSLNWDAMKQIEDNGHLNAVIHRSNCEFMRNRSVAYYCKMLIMPLYLMFKPIDENGIGDQTTKSEDQAKGFRPIEDDQEEKD